MDATGLAELAERARDWAAQDPDPATRAELEELVAHAAGEGVLPDEREHALAELVDRFSGTLAFGTAGLRGALGAGPMRMNRVVVIRAARGLSDYLWAQLGEAPTVVIGYDARHQSDVFARDTADVIAAAGGQALLLPGPLPTPVLAFAVQHLGADAGVMVTASHNPPADNGYKVYLGGRVVSGAGQGAQIVPPADAAIAAAIAAVGRVPDVPREPADGGVVEDLGDSVVRRYLDRALRGVAAEGPVPGAASVRIVHTPLHGVGADLLERVLRGAGFTDLHAVPEQVRPDPDFPTVSFPNPEEAGALDLALALARRVDADLVIANDPDADRCAVAIADPSVDGGWRQLTGDEVGALLGDQAARTAGPGAVLASSIVSSRQLAAIAAAAGVEHRATLTGFKWISRVPGLHFGYEEALGYCVDPDGVRDKDGLTAALAFATLVARLRGEGGAAGVIAGRLDDLARAHGAYATGQLSVRVTDLAQIAAAMTRLRHTPPTALAGHPVTLVRDLQHGTPELPATEGLLYETAAGDRVIVRPSGTEPKLKCYLEAVVALEPVTDDLGAARTRAAARLGALRSDIAAAAGV